MSDPEETERDARYRLITFDLPEIDDIPSLDRALSVVIAKSAAGKIPPPVALVFTRMMEIRRRALSDCELDRRLKAVLAAQRAQTPGKSGGG